MKLWLDDIRHAPEGFIRAHTANEAIGLLKTARFSVVSLDHDLCLAHYAGIPTETKTGHDVVLWMIRHRVWPSLVQVHSTSPYGGARMMEALIANCPTTAVIRRVVP